MTDQHLKPAESASILIVEDDRDLAHLIKDFLASHGYSVQWVDNGTEAVNCIVQTQPDIIILDVMLPGMSGMDVCKHVRPDYLGPILMLTALDEDIDQILGLELGADDYVIKPVKPRVLLSRIKALLRRFEPVSAEKNHNDQSQAPLIIDINERTVYLHGKHLALTSGEFDLLKILAVNLGEVLDKNYLTKELRGIDYDGFDRSIDRRLSRLRKKLKDDSENPQLIKTLRSQGYMLCASKVKVQ